MNSLIQRLRKGPLCLSEYAQVAASSNSLKVRIHNLRQRGFDIQSIPLANGKRRPKVAYLLKSGTCPCCKREIVW